MSLYLTQTSASEALEILRASFEFDTSTPGDMIQANTLRLEGDDIDTFMNMDFRGAKLWKQLKDAGITRYEDKGKNSIVVNIAELQQIAAGHVRDRRLETHTVTQSVPEFGQKQAIALVDELAKRGFIQPRNKTLDRLRPDTRIEFIKPETMDLRFAAMGKKCDLSLGKFLEDFKLPWATDVTADQILKDNGYYKDGELLVSRLRMTAAGVEVSPRKGEVRDRSSMPFGGDTGDCFGGYVSPASDTKIATRPLSWSGDLGTDDCQYSPSRVASR